MFCCPWLQILIYCKYVILTQVSSTSCLMHLDNLLANDCMKMYVFEVLIRMKVWSSYITSSNLRWQVHHYWIHYSSCNDYVMLLSSTNITTWNILIVDQETSFGLAYTTRIYNKPHLCHFKVYFYLINFRIKI